MDIIFSKEVADKLKERYLVLELEKFQVGDGREVHAHCVVPGDKVKIEQIPNLEHDIKLHEQFVEAIKREDYKLCADLAPHMMGKFGGELDSFYDIVSARYRPEESKTN